MFLLRGLCLRLVCVFVSVSLSLAQVPWNTTPLNTQALPLAVRNPYVNTWLPQGKNPAPSNNLWPTFWTGPIDGWGAAVRVDNNITYALLGQSPVWPAHASQTAALYTATQTTFLFQAGPITVNTTFFTPIEPTDLTRQSIPFSYFFMGISSSDGNPHEVQVYSDISGEWLSPDTTLPINWTANTTGSTIILSTKLQQQVSMSENADQARDSTAYYTMLKRTGVSSQISSDVITRSQFNTSGTLTNIVDPGFRPISNEFPVFAISVDLGSITNTGDSPVVWAVGVARDPVIQYTNSLGQVELRSSYFRSQYATTEAAAEFFLNDFSRALATADTLDAKIRSESLQFSPALADLTTLSARQAFAALDITVGKDEIGAFNVSDVKTFLKNIGFTGEGINTADILYAAFPAYLYFSPNLSASLLSPLLEYQDGTLYTLPYAARDLGVKYPSATGNNVPHNQGIEQSGNMLIMVLAQAQASGDGTLIVKHYNLLKRWADYLVTNSLSPNSQTTSDAYPVVNQTNLAIKGIIGVGAMAKMSQLVGNADDASRYQGFASSAVQQWQALALSADQSRILASYGVQSSNALMYNLYADKLLQLKLVPDSVYQQLSGQYSLGNNLFGVPVDSTLPNKTRSDWMMLSAATVTNGTVRDILTTAIRSYIINGQNNNAFPVVYDVSTAVASGGVASPAQGAMFSLLALELPSKNVVVPASSGDNDTKGTSKRSSAGPIAGGVIGGLLGLALIGFLYFMLRRRRLHSVVETEKSVISVPPKSLPSASTTASNAHLTSSLTVEPFIFPTAELFPSYKSPLTASSLQGQGGYHQLALAEAGVYSQSGGSGQSHRRNDSAYFRPPVDMDSDVGPSASQLGRPAGVSPDSSLSPLQAPSVSQVVLAKQTLVNEELRTEVENLRREMERIRLEREVERDAEAPPSYFQTSSASQ